MWPSNTCTDGAPHLRFCTSCLHLQLLSSATSARSDDTVPHIRSKWADCAAWRCASMSFRETCERQPCAANGHATSCIAHLLWKWAASLHRRMPSSPQPSGHGTGTCVHRCRCSCMAWCCTGLPQNSQSTLRKSQTLWCSKSKCRFTNSRQPLKGHATITCSHTRVCFGSSSSRPAQLHPTSSAPQSTSRSFIMLSILRSLLRSPVASGSLQLGHV
mmetsp:Transcript_17842/g.38928  ORF Transcript_17842/g.38928 Transcript_17842/m.38928 type:complete len:216 (-) Transcript_17842:482-1129(-)